MVCGCPKCGKRKAAKTIKHNITTDDFRKKVKKINGNKLCVIGEYVNQDFNIKVKCNICGNVWLSKPKYLIRNQGCSICGHKEKGKKQRKTHETFLNEINEIHDGRLILLEKYVTGKDRIKVKCSICNHIWNPVSRRLLRRGCPNCNISKGELLISKILKKLNINYKTYYIFNNLKTDVGGTPIFDFVIFDKNDSLKMIIEYDGEQHFKPIKKWGGEKRLKRQQKIDKFKNDYCYNHNIQMIRIPYYDFDNIDNEYIKKLINYVE